ncbi:unnamed protein product [Pylaiella littoralis]
MMQSTVVVLAVLSMCVGPVCRVSFILDAPVHVISRCSTVRRRRAHALKRRGWSHRTAPEEGGSVSHHTHTQTGFFFFLCFLCSPPFCAVLALISVFFVIAIKVCLTPPLRALVGGCCCLAIPVHVI